MNTNTVVKPIIAKEKITLSKSPESNEKGSVMIAAQNMI